MSFDELRALLAVVDEGSFLAAAVALGVSRTTLRRQVDALEASAGVPLVHRDRKGVVLTEAGRQLVRSGRVMEQEFTALLHAVRETGRRPAGVVRILLPTGLPPPAMAAVYGLIHANWPEVHVHLRVRDTPLQTNLSDVDVVLWFGDGQPGGAWLTHTVMSMRQRLLADASYLAMRGTPRSIEDLAKHDLLSWLAPDESEPRLYTIDGASLPVHSALVSPDPHLLHECAHMGLGIGWMPDGDLPETLQRPSLVPVLDDVVGRDIELHLAVPRTLAEVPKVRLFIEHLESMRRVIFGQPPPSSAGLPAQPKKKRATAK